MSTSIKRSEFALYLNIGTPGTPDWALIGDGITTGTLNYNPQTSEETYIHQDSGSIEVESYRPTMPFEATCKAGDEVFDYIDNLRVTRAVLAAAQTEVVLVYLYETPTGSDYPAEKQTVSVQIDSFGGDGGASAKINYTINFIGDATAGVFNPTTESFT